MQLISVDSKAISAVGYLRKAKLVVIQFSNGQKWFYKDVPRDVYMEMMESSSVGKYYARKIKGQYHSMPCYL